MITELQECRVSAIREQGLRWTRMAAASLGALLLALVPVTLLAQQADPSPATLTIPRDTPVQLRLTETISSAHARPGDPIQFVVVNDVTEQGFTVIPGGSVANGRVVEVQGKHSLGLPGKLVLELESVQLAGGETVSLRGSLEAKGRPHFVRMTAGMVTLGLFYLPAAPVFLLARGADGIALKSSEVTAQVNEDTPVATAGLSPVQEPAGLSHMLAMLPPRVFDGHGNEGDMINLVFVAAERDLQHAFQSAGWLKVDRATPMLAWRLLQQRMHYAKLPMGRFFLFGRAQDFSFALPDPVRIVAQRHHLRIWKTDCHIHGTPVWVAAATYDTGIEIHARRLGITHRIDPHVDAERDFIAKSLLDTREVTRSDYVSIPDPVFEATTASGQPYYSDSRLAVLDLSPPTEMNAALSFVPTADKVTNAARGGPLVKSGGSH